MQMVDAQHRIEQLTGRSVDMVTRLPSSMRKPRSRTWWSCRYESSLDDFFLILESAQRIYAFTPERYEDLIDDSNGVVRTRSACAFRLLAKPSIEFVQNTQKDYTRQ